MSRAARLIAITAFLAILAGGFEPFYLRIFRADAARMSDAFTELPYRKLPGFRRFLIDVDRSTPPGAHVAICLPFRAWDSGYGYGFNRAGFLLPGKQAVPLLADGADRFEPRNLEASDFVACWHANASPSGFQPLWRSTDGILLRRVQ